MHVDIDRIRAHVEAIAAFTATPGQGATRLTYSPEYRQAYDYLRAAAAPLGLHTRLDAIGNLRMRLEGSDPAAPGVIVGSHVDSVRHGGDFDGVLGVVCGLEALAALVGAGARPRHPVELISFVEEEGTSFGCPIAGSKALAGELDVADLKRLRRGDGESFYDLARGFGVDPDRLAAERLRPETVRAMLELHIEQSSVLETAGVPVGIVEAIAGSEVHRLRLDGLANHAGTTPMGHRRDALAGAAEIVLAAEQAAAASGRASTVATVGRLECHPNAGNVIPGRVELSLDVRDVDAGDIRATAAAILERARGIADARGLGLEVERTGATEPRPLSADVAERCAAAAAAAGHGHRRMHSGALHDAATFAALTEVGLLFVPSRDGRSHTPEEWTDWADIEPAANVLLAVVRELADA